MASIVQQKHVNAATDASLILDDSPTNGNVLVVALVAKQHGGTPALVSGGYTLLGSARADDAENNGDGDLAIYGKVVAGDSTTIERESTSSRMQMRVWELADADLDDITVLSETNQDGAESPDPVTIDLGTFTAADGVAVMVATSTRAAGTGMTRATTDSGDWTIRFENYVDPSAFGQPWAYFGDATPSAADLAAAWIHDETVPGQGVYQWAAVAVLFSEAPVPPPDPEPGVWVDWNLDGFDDGSGGSSAGPDGRLARSLPEPGTSGGAPNDNITADVISFSWQRGATSDHVSQPPTGSCTIIVQNDDGKYTPENTSSSLYPRTKLIGQPVWIGRNADGTLSGSGQVVHGVWAGYIKEIVPVPEGGAANTPTAQLLCEDPLGWYARQPVKVTDEIGRSYTELRTAILDDIGESDDRRDLGPEVDTLPLSAVDSDSALRSLEAINQAIGSRHWIQPADSKEEFYFYTVRDRHHKLGDVTDFSLNADNIQSTEGYRITAENVINSQQIDVSPLHLPAGISTVWTYKDPSFAVGGFRSPTTIRAEFEDFVTDAALDYTATGTIALESLTNYGHFAIIKLWGFGATVSNLTIEGREVIRDSSESVLSEDPSSIAVYGKRAGSTVGSEFTASTTLAQGLADFIVWRFKTAHPRMNVDITNLLSTINGRTLYDTTALTFDRLLLAGKRFELIGEQGYCAIAASASLIDWGITYELQETANQTPLDLFTFDESEFDGSDVLGW